jgi:hypothetical protein
MFRDDKALRREDGSNTVVEVFKIDPITGAKINLPIDSGKEE